jgi:6-phosphogluconolactonase
MHRTVLTVAAGSLLVSNSVAGTERIYIGTKKSKGIYFVDLNTETGRLSAPILAVEYDTAGFITIAPDKQHLYATGVAAFKINPDGSLTKISELKTTEKNSCHVSTDATGRMLMTAYYSSGSVASFKIKSDGTLAGKVSLHKHEGSGDHPTRQQQPHGHSIYPNPANTHAYAADLGIDKIMIYKMDLDEGVLIPAGEAVVPGGAIGPRHMKWQGENLYVLNELDLSISIFRAETDGLLKFVDTVSILADGADKSDLTGAEIRIHPNGKFVYASVRDKSEQKRDAITTLNITDEGLDRISIDFSEVWFPRNFNIDPSGKWLVVGGQLSHDISIFSVDPESGHIKFTGEKIPFEGEPVCFEFLN